ncbi:MAG: putative toxin-antitoxin system toxin component, PIN family [Acidovorax sp.]|uniref:putative toxin-antitoxin system toxin component, PIN family n=1 Tax=Acidovorax sp. TaxID=1872122 RepID=UPI0039E70666
MRVVIDTNVFVGACMGFGASRGVIEACLRQRCLPLMGAALLAEYEDVLQREALFRACRLDGGERDELLDIFLSCCEWTRVYYLWRPNLRDEGDNHLVELAVAGAADRLVTRNLRDLRAMELRFPGLRVVAPEDFLQEL